MLRGFRPLGEQIIIRVRPVAEQIGSIVVPDVAKRHTQQGSDGAAVHFVEADVIAVGPGRRRQDPVLPREMAFVLRELLGGATFSDSGNEPGTVPRAMVNALIERALNPPPRLTPSVKPGDHILFHPAVQSFDRELQEDLLDPDDREGKYYIIREDSILAVIENPVPAAA